MGLHYWQMCIVRLSSADIRCWWQLLLIQGRYKILALRPGSLKLAPAISLFRAGTYMSLRTAGGPVGPGARSGFLTVRNAATCTTWWNGPQCNLGRTAKIGRASCR